MNPRGEAGRPSVAWAGKIRPLDELDAHFAVCGVTGSGKTLTLLTMMKSVLAPEGRLQYRALIYDPKMEFYPWLRGMGVPAESIHVLNPFDERCTRWDIARDITDDASARALAETLIPEQESTNPYFEAAARELFLGVLQGLHERAPGKWDLNDAIEICRDKDILSRFLDDADPTLVAVYLRQTDSHGTTDSILSTLRNRVAPYFTIAHLWARTENGLSLCDWVASSEPSILLVASDDARRASLDAINRALFSRTAELVTGRITPDADETPRDLTWFFLDELRLLGKLPQLDRLLLKGRSRGAHAVLAFQDMLGLRHVYEPLVADEMIGQCLNMAFLRIANPETQKWASAFIGERHYPETTLGGTYAGGYSLQQSETKRLQPTVIPSTFGALPRPTPEAGLNGVFLIRGRPVIHAPEDMYREFDHLQDDDRHVLKRPIPPSFYDAHLPPKSSSPGDARFIERGAQDQEGLPLKSASSPPTSEPRFPDA